MGVEVAGVWELGWNTPIKEVELWEYPLRDFGVEVLHMSPVSGILNVGVEEHHDLGEFIARRRADDHRIVFVDEKGTTPLLDFEHPQDKVLYVCGRTGLSSLTAYGRPGDLSVRIETSMNGGLLWGHQAAAIVLYDRRVKLCR